MLSASLRASAFILGFASLYGAVRVTDRFAGVLITAGNNLPAEASPAGWPYLALLLFVAGAAGVFYAFRPGDDL